MISRMTVLLSVMGLSAMAAPALAHMPYVAPSVFDAGDRKQVTIEASFTEDAFRPDIAMNDAPFEVTGPDGATIRLSDQKMFKDMTVVEAPLAVEGIYRLSSGQRLGRMGKMFKAGDDWKMVGEGAKAPAGATLVDVQSTTLADAYVLRGKPGATGALAARGKALELHPASDPTALTAGTPFAMEVLFDRKPLAGATVSLFREAGYYDGKKMIGETVADRSGKLAVTPPDAGRYLLLVRHRGSAPTGAAAPYYSYTVTLAFEAM